MQDAAFLAALMGAAVPAGAQSAPASHVRYVPATTASAPTIHRVPIAAHELARGTVLRASDIAWSDTTPVSPRDSFAVQPGWIARRPFRAGEPLAEPGVARPDLVKSGDAVDVVYSGNGVTIKVRGTAVGSGAAGDEVYVRLENRRRLRGVIAGANTVRVM